MPAPLRVLVLEDRADDAELLVHELEESGFALEWHRVEAESEYVAEVQLWLPDVVLADYALPQYDALQALHWLQAHQPYIPLIVITAQTSEEAAVACIQPCPWAGIPSSKNSTSGGLCCQAAVCSQDAVVGQPLDYYELSIAPQSQRS